MDCFITNLRLTLAASRLDVCSRFKTLHDHLCHSVHSKCEGLDQKTFSMQSG